MQQPYSYSRERPPSSNASENRSTLSAHRHMCIMRHSMACRDRELEGNRRPCQFPVCAQMRQVLDHVLRCTRGTDCTFEYCVTSKQLQAHANNCVNPYCMVCQDPPYPQVPNNQHGQSGGFPPQPNSQICTSNGYAGQNFSQTAENSTEEIRNGFDWRTRFNPEIRERLIKKYAEQVFPPATFHDARAAKVVKYFQDEENGYFRKSETETEYLDMLQKFAKTIRDNIKLKMGSSGVSITNGSSTALDSSSRADGGIPIEIKTPAASIMLSRVKHEPDNANYTPEVPFSNPPVTASAKKEDVKPESPLKQEPTAPKDAVKPDNNRRYAWTKNELISVFLPFISEISEKKPYVDPFLLPVAYEELGLTDYLNVIRRPMDISTIKKTLEDGGYTDPWSIVDDFWLMFNNAWTYNKKNSTVYKLAEIFEKLIDPVMQKLGFCCGREFVHYPHVLACATERSCNINRDAVYYVYDNSGDDKKKNLWDKYFVCEKCYMDANEKIAIDDPSAPLFLSKSLFKQKVNDTIVREEFVNCRECGRKWHKVCACHMDEIWSCGFVCKSCISAYNITRAPNRFTSKKLPRCKLSDFLEKRVNDFMKKNESQAKEVTIRVLASANKSVEVKKYMRKNFSSSERFPESFPYRVKVLFAFQELDGQEVCFFGLHVQEYSSDCPPPNTRRVYIAYLDSVYFFQPRQYRTDVYHEILVGYLLYAKRLGFATAHIWACPPIEGDDYIFHMHPADQKIPKPKRLQEWYQKMLKRAHNERIVVDYNNIHQDTCDIKRLTPVDLPYFEGDFWPNTLEDIFKSVEEIRRKLREEEELLRGDVDDIGDDLNDDGDSNHAIFDSDRKPGSAGSGGGSSKKKKKKRKMKRTASALSIAGVSSKRKRLLANCDIETEVQRRLEETLVRNAESFLTINLYHPSQVSNLQPIEDTDPLFSSEMMECRDTFLSRARDRHLEFSTLRRAKFSTLAMLYDVHTENKDVYFCNHCQREFAFPLQCKQCANFHLCEACYVVVGHKHPMISEDSVNNPTVQQSGRTKVELFVKLLEHACTCRDANCRTSLCRTMRSRLEHFLTPHDRDKCMNCRQLHKILAAHSNKCTNLRCQVACCEQYKALKKQQESQQRLRKVQTLRRRQKNMQRYNSQTSQQPNTPQPTQVTNSSAVGAPPPPQPAQLMGSTSSPTVSQCTPNSSEPPHSFSSQTSITSPHSVPNPRNSPAKPTTTAGGNNTQAAVVPHPAVSSVSSAQASGIPPPVALHYSHPSPYQQHLQPSPLPLNSNRPGSVHAQQQTPSYHPQHAVPTSEYQQSSLPGASPYGAQQQMYQQQQQHAQMMQQQPPTPQQMVAAAPVASKTVYSAAEVAAFARQTSNPSTVMSTASSISPGFYENGQITMSRMPPHPRMPYAPTPMSSEMEDPFSGGVYLKRQIMSESDMLQSVGACGGGVNSMYTTQTVIGGGKPMMQRSMSAAMAATSQKQMHCAPINGQLPMPPMSPKMTPSRPQPQQQGIPNPSPLFTQEDVQRLQEVHQKLPEADFVKWLQQRPQLYSAWNYLQQHQVKQQQMAHHQQQQQQYAQQHQMIMRNNMAATAGYYPQANVPRMVQPSAGGGPMMGNAWSGSPQHQMSQVMDPRSFRPAAVTCHAPPSSGNPAVYGQQQQRLPQHQQQLTSSGSMGPYATTVVPGFPSQYPNASSNSVGGRIPMAGVVPMASTPRQRLPTTPMSLAPPGGNPGMSPHRVQLQQPYPPPTQLQQQPSQLSQLLGQPQQQGQATPGNPSRPSDYM